MTEGAAGEAQRAPTCGIFESVVYAAITMLLKGGKDKKTKTFLAKTQFSVILEISGVPFKEEPRAVRRRKENEEEKIPGSRTIALPALAHPLTLTPYASCSSASSRILPTLISNLINCRWKNDGTERSSFFPPINIPLLSFTSFLPSTFRSSLCTCLAILERSSVFSISLKVLFRSS